MCNEAKLSSVINKYIAAYLIAAIYRIETRLQTHFISPGKLENLTTIATDLIRDRDNPFLMRGYRGQEGRNGVYLMIEGAIQYTERLKEKPFRRRSL